MGYLDSKKREDIDGIIAETLSGYYGTKVSVLQKYHKNSFILNPRLNTAVFCKPDRYIKKTVYKWHKVQTNRLLRLVMDIYILFAFSKRGHFGCKYISFDTLPDNPKMLYIMPGNMKIKVFDFSENKIHNILKSGFVPTGYENEKKVRINPKWDFILPIKDCKDTSYTENLLKGCSIDRFKGQNDKLVQDRMKKIILDIQKDSRSSVLAKEYFSEKLDTVSKKILELNSGESILDSITGFLTKLQDYIRDENFALSKSHGDLQNGNIFVSENGNIYIIDWETVGIRSIGYDLLTYYYKFRYRTDFLKRIDFFLNDDLNLDEFYFDGQISKKLILCLYFIEDIEWLIDETRQTADKNITAGLTQYSDKQFQKEIFDRLGK